MTYFESTFTRWIFLSRAAEASSEKHIAHRIHLARHDHHNLELKTFVDPGKTGFQGWLEVHLFVPGSFQLSRWDKKELRSDLHCRARLAISVCPEQGHAALREAMRRLRLSVEEFDSFETLGEDSKDAGAAIHETFRRWTSLHKKQCRLAHSLIHREPDAANHLSRLCYELKRSAESIQMVRDTLQQLEPNRFPVLGLLDEYTSNLYLKYLSDMELELARCPVNRFRSAGYQRAHEQLRESLTALRQAEAARLSRAGMTHPPTDAQRESQLVRLSQLKKFFQSKMFVDVARQPLEKRVAETTAFVGTALAGLSAATLQHFYYPSADEIAVSGVFLLGFGVVVYTVRDRIKDWLKTLLAKKASSWIADLEETLWIDGKRMGLNKEWFRVGAKDKLTSEALRLRTQACTSEVEKELPEEVLTWKRWQWIPESLGQRGQDLALQENVRINIERYLKFMDDPFKELAVLDPNGEFTRFRSRRVYHFYLAVRSSFRSCPSPANTQFGSRPNWKAPAWPTHHQSERIFRIVMNKTGIDRIESVDEKDIPHKPEWYHSFHAHPGPLA